MLLRFCRIEQTDRLVFLDTPNGVLLLPTLHVPPEPPAQVTLKPHAWAVALPPNGLVSA